jgi:hypothetical protein
VAKYLPIILSYAEHVAHIASGRRGLEAAFDYGLDTGMHIALCEPLIARAILTEFELAGAPKSGTQLIEALRKEARGDA